MSVFSSATKRESLGSVLSFRSTEWRDDSDIVCADWTKVSDGEAEDDRGYRCDRDTSATKIKISPPNVQSTHYVIVPKSAYIRENLILFHAMCNIEDMHFSDLEVADQERLMKSVVVETYSLGDYDLRWGS